MPDEELPHRRSSSRQTFFTDSHVVHAFEDGECKQNITRSADPNEVLEFMQNLVEWYESDVADPEGLLLYAKVDDSGFVYIRDRRGGEWVMWSVNEWVAPKPGVDVGRWNKNGKDALEDDKTGINETTVQAVINAIIWTYEEPSNIREQFSRAQIETCD